MVKLTKKNPTEEPGAFRFFITETSGHDNGGRNRSQSSRSPFPDSVRAGRNLHRPLNPFWVYCLPHARCFSRITSMILQECTRPHFPEEEMEAQSFSKLPKSHRTLVWRHSDSRTSPRRYDPRKAPTWGALQMPSSLVPSNEAADPLGIRFPSSRHRVSWKSMSRLLTSVCTISTMDLLENFAEKARTWFSVPTFPFSAALLHPTKVHLLAICISPWSTALGGPLWVGGREERAPNGRMIPKTGDQKFLYPRPHKLRRDKLLLLLLLNNYRHFDQPHPKINWETCLLTHNAWWSLKTEILKFPPINVFLI